MPCILIIEDETRTRDNLAVILGMEGYQTLTAAQGAEGLKLARTKVPDLILCDVTMPELDGFQVLTALRADAVTSAIPFIFLTAKSDRADHRTGMTLGADDYLSKPATAEEVLDAVESRLIRQTQFQSAPADYSSTLPLEGLGLSPREAEVLLWVAQGKSNNEVGTILGNAEKTVKIHLGRIFEKLGVDNRYAATLRALEVLR
ncbi:MAG: response regulator transcription factor [Verrucomicrobium sp.]